MIKSKLIRFIAAATLCLSTSVIAMSPTDNSSSQSTFSPNQVKQIEKIIHNYLVSKPEVLLEASRALQQQQMNRMQQSAVAAIRKNIPSIFSDSASPSVGNVNAPVVLVEFFDYQCGHCKAMRPVIDSIIKDNKDLRVIFKELPIFGADSTFAAKAALASAMQGKYYAFHNALLAANDPITNDKVFQVAKKMGLDIKKLKTDMKNPAYEKQIKANFKLAEALRLVGTPAFIISNKAHTKFRFIPGAAPKNTFIQAINAVK